jgi:hypothetical protein
MKFIRHLSPKSLLKRLKKLLNTPRRRIIASGIILILFMLTYFSVALASVSDSEIALETLKQSFEAEKICHENCYLYRLGQEKIVTEALSNNSNKTQKRLEKYWRDETLNSDFRIEIIKLYKIKTSHILGCFYFV